MTRNKDLLREKIWCHSSYRLVESDRLAMLKAAREAKGYHPIFNRLRPDLCISDDRCTAAVVKVEASLQKSLQTLKSMLGMSGHVYMRPTFIRTSANMNRPQYFHTDFPEAKASARSVLIILGPHSRSFDIRVDGGPIQEKSLHPGGVYSFPGHLVHRGGVNTSNSDNYAFHVYLVPKVVLDFLRDPDILFNQTTFHDPEYVRDNSNNRFEIRQTDHAGLGLFCRRDFTVTKGTVLCKFFSDALVSKEEIKDSDFYLKLHSSKKFNHIPCPLQLESISKKNWFDWAAYYANDGKVSKLRYSQGKECFILRPSGKVNARLSGLSLRATKVSYKRDEEILTEYGSGFWKDKLVEPTKKTSRISKKRKQ